MAEVIPGFTTRFDIDHVLAAIASRHFLVVSGTDDKYAADAQELVDAALAALGAPSDDRTLSHLQVTGGHALEAQRFAAIVDWIVHSVTGST